MVIGKDKELSAGVESLLLKHQHGNFSPGMIRLVVKEVAKRAGIKNPRELSAKANLHYETCRLLWAGNTKMIGLDTIEHLCTLLQVPPCQLFEFEADPSVLTGETGKAKKTPQPSKSQQRS